MITKSIQKSTTDISLVFFGSGPVAAASLRLLHKSFTIEAVVTKPRLAHHKGAVPVLEACEELNLRVSAPANKTELSALFATKPCTSPVGVVIDYGIIINQDVIDYFPFGIVNSHFSLLPEWRGADPITFAILSGQTQTGVSLMLINDKMDEGLLLAQTPYALDDAITTPELTHDLIELSNESLKQVLPLYLDGNAIPAPQDTVSMADSKTPTYSRKLTKDDGQLDWSKTAERLEREIRAFIEWPKSRTTIAGKDVIITAAHVASNGLAAPTGAAGTLFTTPDGLIGITTGKGIFVIDKLKPAGKQEMSAAAFLNGYGKKL